jgi:hypothetical protein
MIGRCIWSRSFPENWADQPGPVSAGFSLLALIAVVLVVVIPEKVIEAPASGRWDDVQRQTD